MSNPNENWFAIAEGDRITNIEIKQKGSQWIMEWDLLSLKGEKFFQEFIGNETLQRVNTDLIKGQFIKTININSPFIKIVFSNGTGLQFPLTQ